MVVWPVSLSCAFPVVGKPVCATHISISGGPRTATSRISVARFIALIPERLAGFERVSDALLRLALATEREKRLSLEIEQVLLADRSPGSHTASAENIRRPAGHFLVVLRCVTRLAHQEDAGFKRGQRRHA